MRLSLVIWSLTVPCRTPFPPPRGGIRAPQCVGEKDEQGSIDAPSERQHIWTTLNKQLSVIWSSVALWNQTHIHNWLLLLCFQPLSHPNGLLGGPWGSSLYLFPDEKHVCLFPVDIFLYVVKRRVDNNKEAVWASGGLQGEYSYTPREGAGVSVTLLQDSVQGLFMVQNGTASSDNKCQSDHRVPLLTDQPQHNQDPRFLQVPNLSCGLTFFKNQSSGFRFIVNFT